MYGRHSQKLDVAFDAYEREYGAIPSEVKDLGMDYASKMDANRLAYGLFMAEAEGYLDTRESKMVRLLKDLKDKHNCGITYVELDQDYVSQFGLDIESFTQKDVNRCERALLSGRY